MLESTKITGNEPWHIFVPGFQPPDTNTGFTTIGQSSSYFLASYRLSSGSQNDEVGWDLVVAAGTWELQLLHGIDGTRGIYTISVDGVDKGTIDGYNAATNNAGRTVLTGITAAETKKQRVKFKMATKNASSPNYYGVISGFSLHRTA